MWTVYSLALVWRERGRYVPAVLAVAFSALLIVLQFGLLLGMQSVVLLAFNQPLSWTFGGTSQQPKSLRLTLRGMRW